MSGRVRPEWRMLREKTPQRQSQRGIRTQMIAPARGILNSKLDEPVPSMIQRSRDTASEIKARVVSRSRFTQPGSQ
ncbi:hypothetical protein GCM10010924_09200 [Rhizobium wenxiniae]|nr:hypothetical protein GCM10010924_09200 [Rhizobium wenxiniae]